MATNLGWQDWSEFSKNELEVTPGVTVLDRNWKDTWRTGIAFGNFAGTRGVVLWPVLRQLTGIGQE